MSEHTLTNASIHVTDFIIYYGAIFLSYINLCIWADILHQLICIINYLIHSLAADAPLIEITTKTVIICILIYIGTNLKRGP